MFKHLSKLFAVGLISFSSVLTAWFSYTGFMGLAAYFNMTALIFPVWHLTVPATVLCLAAALLITAVTHISTAESIWKRVIHAGSVVDNWLLRQWEGHSLPIQQIPDYIKSIDKACATLVKETNDLVAKLTHLQTLNNDTRSMTRNVPFTLVSYYENTLKTIQQGLVQTKEKLVYLQLKSFPPVKKLIHENKPQDPMSLEKYSQWQDHLLRFETQINRLFIHLEILENKVKDTEIAFQALKPAGNSFSLLPITRDHHDFLTDHIELEQKSMGNPWKHKVVCKR